jgi:hypothetical protein
VAKCHPAPAALCKAVKTGFFLLVQAYFAWRDVIQAAAVVNCFALQKRVLMHEGDHPAQDLVAGKPSKLNRGRAKSRDSISKDCSSGGFGPTMEQEAWFRRALLT